MLINITEPGQIERPQSQDVAIGIDLGTTNSVAAYMQGESCQYVKDKKGKSILPSVVAFKAAKVVVGEKARDVRGGVIIQSVKRLLGRSRDDLKTLQKHYPHPVVADENGALAISINERKISPIVVSSEILKALKKNAEADLGRPVTRAVVTVPAYFDDTARSATKQAAKLAGLDVLRLINEPTAAALAYGLDNQAEGVYAVYDLGGGTFDVSILKMEKGVFRVLATGGDTFLGGDDMDHLVLEHLLKQAQVRKKPWGWELLKALAVAKYAKEFLTNSKSWKGNLSIAKHNFKVSLTRDELDAQIRGLVTKTIKVCEQVLVDAKLQKSDIKDVVLVGGATRTPLVKQKLKEFFGKAPLDHIDPDRVVAQGAALQAAALTFGSDNLLIDVTPLSLGIETMGGVVERIIERNTPIPATKTQEFTTYQDGQSSMKIHVLQGEREMVDKCRSLAEFSLKGIPPMKAGFARIQVTFALDADGLLVVSAKEKTTGIEQVVEVKPSYGLPPERVEEMLKDSFAHAKEDIVLRLLTESRVEAAQTINLLKQALEEDGTLVNTDYRTKIDMQVAHLEQLMAGTDREAIDHGVQVLDKLSSEFAEKRVNKAMMSALGGKTIKAIQEMVAKK